MIAIGGAGSGVDKAPGARIARCDQHVEEAVDIGRIGEQRILDGARHGAERSLVQDIIDARACRAAGVELADVALDEAKVRPLGWGHARLDLIEIFLVPGGKVVQADHVLAKP